MPKKPRTIQDYTKDELFSMIRKEQYKNLKVYFTLIYNQGYRDGKRQEELKREEQVITRVLNKEFFKNNKVNNVRG